MKRVRVTSRDPVTKYACDVTKGKIIAGPHVRAACQRHLDDLEEAAERGFFFDLEKVDRVIGFYRDVLRLNGGEYEGKPYELLDWQKFVVGSIFGWVDAEGLRRFRIAYIETGKGSGKSPLEAGIGLYGLVADGEMRAEVYAAATKKDQAMVLFRDAVAMVDQSPLLASKLKKSGRHEQTWNIRYAKSGSFFRPISSDDGQSGPRPHIGLIDEVHEHKTAHMIDMMKAGFKFRKQPLIAMITNSGSDKNSPCGLQHDYGIKVVSGQVQDDQLFAYICALDEGEDPFEDEKCWHKVNPSLRFGIPTMKYLRGQVNDAKGMPSQESIVRRLNFCQWVKASNPFITTQTWINNGDIPRGIDGCDVYGGLDLSSVSDLTALVLVSERENKFDVNPTFWLPAQGLAEKSRKDRVPYDVWERQGFIQTTPGSSIEYEYIAEYLRGVFDNCNVRAIAFDRYNMKFLKPWLERVGFTEEELERFIEFGQGFVSMSPALRETESLLLNNKLRHGKHPVLTMCASNAVIATDPAGNRKFAKDKASGRIDGMVALAMAVGVMPNAASNEKSFWEAA